MKLRAHLLAALPLGGAYYWSEGSAVLAGLAAAASVLVDVDHLPDYLWWRRGWRGLEDFFDASYKHRVPFILIVTHSWELMALAWGLILTLGAPPWVQALAVGWLYHLAWDQWRNSVGARFYFLLHRARMGFQRRLLKPEPQTR